MHLRPWKAIVFSVLASLLVMLPGWSSAQKELEPPKIELPEVVKDARIGASIAKGQLLITLHEGVKEEELTPIFARMEAKFQIVERIPSMNHFRITTDHDRLPELRQRLENHPYVAAVSYNVLVSMKRVTNDPVFKKPADMQEDKDNWNLYRIKAPEAWDMTQGGAVVAVIDTGAVLEHEELVGRTTDPFSFATRDSLMQMGMKKIKYGENFYGKEEVRNHGTHVAITIGGKVDNGVGTAGVAPNSPIMPLQALTYLHRHPAEDAGEIRGWGSDITNAIIRAIDRGAQVINMSLGGVNPDDLARWRAAKSAQEKQVVYDKMTTDAKAFADQLAPVLDRAVQAGVIIVVAAGNDDIPAEFGSYAMSGRCIVVSATTREDKRCNFMNSEVPGQPRWGSNYGPYTTVSAPGHEIWSGWAEPGKLYSYSEGTSMACPHVAGVVALMKTLDPELKLADVADILVKTGKPLQTDQPIGPLVNAKAAVDEVKKRQATRVPRQPNPPPIVRPPVVNPTLPTLPREGVEILTQPDPWNNPDVQRIIQVWFSFAIVAPPAGGDAGGTWIYNQFGQVVNIRTTVTMQQSIWFQFRFRWFWENALTLQSTNMGSLYEFVVGTLRQGRFDPAPPRVPENFRPRANDPRPREGGLPFNPSLGGTRWSGRNGKAETLEFEFGTNVVTIKRLNTTTRYTVRINTALRPAPIDFFPDGGGAPVLGSVELVGIGEMLVRTDFTNKRPTTVSRGDPLTFVLRRVDVAITETGSGDDGAQMPILNRGIESLLVTYPVKTLPKGAQPPIWSLPEGFQLHNYSLSKDGQRVWVLLYDGRASVKKASQFQLWSMRLDGSDAKQATFALDLKIYRAPTVITNRDGSIAWLFTTRPVPFQDYYHVQLQQVTPGGIAKVILEAKDHKGITNGWDSHVTHDGQSLLFVAQEGIVRVKADGSAHVEQRTKDIVHGDYSLPDPRERFSEFVINADGSHWAAIVRFFHYKKAYQSKKVPHAVVIGSPKGYQLSIIDPKLASNVYSLGMSDDGKTVLIERQYSLLLWRDGHVKPILPDAHEVYNGALSADGNSLYALSNYAGTTATGLSGFVQDLTTGRRRLAISGFMGARLLKNGQSIQINQDGTVVTSFSSGLLGDFGPSSLYVSRVGVLPPADFPQIKSIRQRYDAGKLVVTVEASAEGPHRVIAIPLKNGYINPAHLIAPAQNPLHGMAGLPNGHDLAPLPKRPGVFQTSVDLGDKHALLDHTYSIRIMVVNAGRNRATYQDVATMK